MDTPNKPSTNETRDGQPWNGIFREEDEVEGVGYVIAHYHEGRIHRDDDEPAYTRFDEHGQVCEHRWIKNGLCTRTHGPACVEYDDIGGKSKEEWYNADGELHSTDDHPAVIEYRYGTITRQAWYDRNLRHRDGDKPSELQWDSDGAFIKAAYHTHDEPDRENGPAIVQRLHTQEAILEEEEQWFRGGVIHRTGGPAFVQVLSVQDDNGDWQRKTDADYFVWVRDGKPYEPSAHERMKWQATQNRQGGPLWKEPEEPHEPVATKPQGVKAAAAAAAAQGTKAPGTRPKATQQDER